MSGAKHGDIVKATHTLYAHYGVYAESPDGPHIIHYTGENGPGDFNGMVRETPIDIFLNGEKDYTVCKFDHKRYKTVYSSEETVERARSRLGQKSYDILKNNCEHFAVWCKTGMWESLQVEKFNLLSGMFSFLEDIIFRK